MMGGCVFSGHQPNFIPYMGFFYKMFKSDVFVLDDDVQYSRRAYHNSNFLIANAQKLRITVPVSYNYGDIIKDVRICYAKDWATKLFRTIKMNYRKSPHFNEGYELIEKHIGMEHKLLADLNIGLIKDIASKLGLKCRIVVASRDVPTNLKKQQRNIYQCKKLGGTVYYSGPGGKSYDDEAGYAMNGIKLIYSDYSPVEFEQARKGQIVNLSVLDYILNRGYALPEKWGATP